MATVLDVEQSLLLLELSPPFDQRDVQLARRKMAKVWHPDIAPPGRQHEHERHLKAINEAADQLESLAEGSRGGRVSANAVKVSAAAAKAARAEEGRRAYEAAQARAAEEQDRKQNDPFGSQVPDHSVVHRYARCLSYPEWGVGNVTGIYFTGAGDDIQQWARVNFQIGVRTVPAGSLQFVDFSKPDAGAERVQRFMTAAQHAMAEGDYPLAAQRLIYAPRTIAPAPQALRLAARKTGIIDIAKLDEPADDRAEPAGNAQGLWHARRAGRDHRHRPRQWQQSRSRRLGSQHHRHQILEQRHRPRRVRRGRHPRLAQGDRIHRRHVPGVWHGSVAVSLGSLWQVHRVQQLPEVPPR